MNHKVVDITGLKYGHLLVLNMNTRKVGEDGKLEPVSWHCLCDCGKEVDVPGAQLRKSSNRTSCGCIKKQQHAPRAKKDVGNIIKLANAPESSVRNWGPCPYPSELCALSLKGWCCYDCNVPNCEDRCLNTPEKCKVKRLKKG